MVQKLWGRFRAKYKKLGKKALIGIFFYYLIRDLTLYVAIPLWVASKVAE